MKVLFNLRTCESFKRRRCGLTVSHLCVSLTPRSFRKQNDTLTVKSGRLLKKFKVYSVISNDRFETCSPFLKLISMCQDTEIDYIQFSFSQTYFLPQSNFNQQLGQQLPASNYQDQDTVRAHLSDNLRVTLNNYHTLEAETNFSGLQRSLRRILSE